MPSTRKMTNKAGDSFYEIRVSRGRSATPLSMRWYPPTGWGQRAIDRELSKVTADFERRCQAGEIISRSERHEREADARRAAARIQTLKQYSEDVFMPAKTISISENSRSSFQGMLDKWIYPALGDLKLPDITPANITALLRALRSEQAAQAISSYVFTQDGSPEPMHPQSPTRYLKKFAKRYNVPDLHPHKLRHTFASIAITSGADVASVSEKLGHSDKAVTLRMYTHADQESMKRASQIFRDALKQDTKKAGQG